jgi:hypothetical protein
LLWAWLTQAEHLQCVRSGSPRGVLQFVAFNVHAAVVVTGVAAAGLGGVTTPRSATAALLSATAPIKKPRRPIVGEQVMSPVRSSEA